MRPRNHAKTLAAIAFHFSFRVAGDQDLFLAGDGFGGAEAAYPLIHMCFELGGGAEGVDAHGAEEMADAFAWHARGHGDIGGEGRDPGAIVGAAEKGRKDIDDVVKGIAFMTAMVFVAPQRQEGAAVL